jgi:hypothetical protein
MIFTFRGFGNSPTLMPRRARPPNPNRPDPRAVAELEAYDLLPPEARATVRESPNDVALADKLSRVRGIMPAQLGLGGILAELVADELGTKADGGNKPA